MEFTYNDGGRSKYFKATNVGDCVARAISNATGVDYLEVYKGINAEAKKERSSKRKTHTSTSRNGVYTATAKRYIENVLGWVWVPCMSIGTGCKVHVREGELPKSGSYILNLSGHFSCWKDNTLVDTYDCSRDGTRCVYGYWRAPNKNELNERRLESERENTRKSIETRYNEALNSKKEEIKSKHCPTINKLEKKIKELTHKLVLEKNRLARELDKARLAIEADIKSALDEIK